jgi:protein-L-isoaspartate O-methyltransferase
MRVLEIGAGTGQVAAVLAKHWNVSVVTLEPIPWNDLNTIQKYADERGVGNKVLAMNTLAQKIEIIIIIIGNY